MWQGLMLIATICLAIARLIQKILLKDVKIDTYSYSIYFELSVAFIILPIALLNNFTIPSLTDIWPQFLLMILLYGFFNIFFYRAVQAAPISEVMIISATAPIWATAASILFLGYKLDPVKLLGIILAVSGVAFVFYQKRKFKFSKGHFYAFAATVFFGIAITNDSFLLLNFNQTTYSFLYWLLPALFIALINPKKLDGVKPLLAKGACFRFLVPAVLYAMAALLVTKSFHIGAQASQVGVMMQLSPIFTIALGAIFLNEKENLRRKLIGGIVVVIGIICNTWF